MISKENLALKNEIEEAIKLIQQVQMMKMPLIDLKRSKRQAESINCTQLKEDLIKIQIQIQIVQQNITNSTATLNTINQKILNWKLELQIQLEVQKR